MAEQSTDLVATAADRWPERTVLASDEGRSATATALDETVGRRAGALIDAGVAEGDRVGICRADRWATVIDIFALMRLNAVAAPVDPNAGLERLSALVDAGSLTHLVVEDARNVPAPVTAIDTAALVNGERIGGRPRPADQPSSLLFTSGTTGEPTPVIHTAANHEAAAANAVAGLDLDRHDRWYDPLGLHHMGGFAPLVRCLPHGIQVVISDEVAPSTYLECADDTGATVVSVVPTMVHDALERGDRPPPSLDCLLVGGAPLRESLFRRARAAGYPVWPSYGLTETIGQVATATPGERERHPGTVGRPLPGSSVTILDETGANRPPGIPGRIAVTAGTVSPERGTPVSNGWQLITADIGEVDDEGRLWVHGRQDDAIQTGGTLVFPASVEAVLLEHPTVTDAAVFGLPDDRWGERVTAAVVGERIDPAAIDEHARSQLDPPAIPKAIHQVDDIPRTVSGTVDRTALIERLDSA